MIEGEFIDKVGYFLDFDSGWIKIEGSTIKSSSKNLIYFRFVRKFKNIKINEKKSILKQTIRYNGL